ncbi:MAG: HAMP domain-containing histidine kinase [Candidatus Omnitrophica bacterium]|nr:HAMP domain-containing histidine kinase [Candidatus Omnitrophota bacterium]
MPNMELIKDGVKIIIISIPLIYFLIISKDIVLKQKRFLLLTIGFSILMLGGIMDFADEFARLNNVFLLGANFYYHERIEDILGLIGFVLFFLGIAIEIGRIKKENVDKKDMIQTLQEQAEQLKKYDELKSKFVEDVSHEFRSPIASISMSISNIIDGLMGDVSEEQRSALDVGKRNLDRLSRLARDMLTLSQIKSGKIVLLRRPNDISALVEEACLSLKPIFEEKHIKFSNTSYLKDPKVWCDGDRLLQLFVNLLSNGLKYSPSDTQISVRISEEGRNIRVEVEDQGRGMSQKDADKLFSRFEKLDAKEEDAVGLGLAIAKEIVTIHHGKIWVESKLNEGTRFIFTIPKDLRKEDKR